MLQVPNLTLAPAVLTLCMASTEVTKAFVFSGSTLGEQQCGQRSLYWSWQWVKWNQSVSRQGQFKQLDMNYLLCLLPYNIITKIVVLVNSAKNVI